MDRVLEIGGYAAGFCGRLFVHAGYEVVRVETDPSWPSWVSSAAHDLYLHPGKRRVHTSDGRLIAELAARADVVVAEAPTADGIDALGLDAWSAPVKVAITPFGRTGPKRNWQATPSTLLAMGGYTNVMGDPDRAPLTLPGHFAEFQSGVLAYTAATACRLAGEPNDIDVSILEAILASSQFTTVLWHCAGEIRSRHGSDYWSVVPSNLFRCADGWVYVNVVPNFWDAFAAFIDCPELVLDERFATNGRRMENRDALHAIIASTLAPLSRREIMERADEFRVPCGAVLTLDEVLENDHLAARGVWQPIADPGGRDVATPALPWRIHGDTPPGLALAPVEASDG